jgi:beta-glucosidase
LRAFRRIHLDPGQSAPVEFELKPRDLSMVNDDGDIVVPSGKYGVSIGGGQPGSGLPTIRGEFSLSGSLKLPE